MTSRCNTAKLKLTDAVNEPAGPSSLADRIITAGKSSIFGSLPTISKSLFGNPLHVSAELGGRTAASTLDAALAVGRSIRTGGKVSPNELRTVLSPWNKLELQESMKAFKGGLRPFAEAKNAVNELPAGSSFGKRMVAFSDGLRHALGSDDRIRASLDEYTRTQFKNPIVQAGVDAVFATLEGADRPVWLYAHQGSLVHQARLNALRELPRTAKGAAKDKLMKDRTQYWLDNPTEEMQARAFLDAQKMTFKDRNPLGEVAQRSKEALRSFAQDETKSLTARRIANVGRMGVEFTLPATGVPSAVALRSAQYTPLGFIETAFALAGKDWEKVATSAGKASMGLGGVALGKELFDKGYITGPAPKNPREREQFFAEGKLPYHFKFTEDGDWNSYAWFGPISSAVGYGASLEQTKRDMAEGESGLNSVLSASASWLTEQMYFDNIKRILDAPEQRGGVQRAAAGLVPIPALVRQTAQVLDPVDRAPENIGQSLARNIPIASRYFGGPERVRPFVDNSPREGYTRISGLTGPNRLSPNRATPISRELGRLGIGLGTPDRSITVGGESRRLSEAEHRELVEDYDDIATEWIEELMSSEAYASSDDAMKEKALRRLMTRARAMARSRVETQKPTE